MIRLRNDLIYLPMVTFSELNAFSQNYLPFWPSNHFEVADLLRVLLVIVIDRGNLIRDNYIHRPTA